MSSNTTQLIENLNHDNMTVRLESLRSLMAGIGSGELQRPHTGRDVNNHIHTTYSFSPYSPAKSVWMAYQAGLVTAGIMDHDSISGAREFIEAGKIREWQLPLELNAGWIFQLHRWQQANKQSRSGFHQYTWPSVFPIHKLKGSRTTFSSHIGSIETGACFAKWSKE